MVAFFAKSGALAFGTGRLAETGAPIVTDNDYYAKRAEAERLRAQTATAPAAVRVHRELAELYRDRIRAEPAATGQLVRG